MARVVPWRLSAPPAVRAALGKVGSVSLKVVDEPGPTSFVLASPEGGGGGGGKRGGRRGLAYHVFLGDRHSCSCGADELCVHILYVLATHLGVATDNPLLWQLSLAEHELDAILAERPTQRVRSRTRKPYAPPPSRRRRRRRRRTTTTAREVGGSAGGAMMGTSYSVVENRYPLSTATRRRRGPVSRPPVSLMAERVRPPDIAGIIHHRKQAFNQLRDLVEYEAAQGELLTHDALSTARAVSKREQLLETRRAALAARSEEREAHHIEVLARVESQASERRDRIVAEAESKHARFASARAAVLDSRSKALAHKRELKELRLAEIRQYQRAADEAAAEEAREMIEDYQRRVEAISSLRTERNRMYKSVRDEEARFAEAKQELLALIQAQRGKAFDPARFTNLIDQLEAESNQRLKQTSARVSARLGTRERLASLDDGDGYGVPPPPSTTIESTIIESTTKE